MTAKSIVATGAQRQIRAATLQSTIAPRAYKPVTPMDRNSCVIVHKVPRSDASLKYFKKVLILPLYFKVMF